MDAIKTKLKSKKDELKSFMQSSDKNAAIFTKQLDDIITDRLVQDFPLFESVDIMPLHSANFTYASILPLSRLWSRACKAKGTKNNNIFIGVPNKKHFS